MLEGFPDDALDALGVLDGRNEGITDTVGLSLCLSVGNIDALGLLDGFSEGEFDTDGLFVGFG